MKFRNYLDTIADIGLYPLVSLLLFVAFFVGLLWYVLSMNKKDVKHMSNLPLDDGTPRKAILTTFLVLGSLGAFAQEAKPAAAGNDELLLYIVIIIIVFVALLLGAILVQVAMLVNKLNNRVAPEKQESVLFSESWWKKFRGINVSLSEEDKILIKEHDYDGIQELDNRMPPWLAFLFQGTILFSVIYLLIYHVFSIGDLPQAELEKDLQAAAVQKAAFLEREGAKIDENSVVLATEPADLEKGKALFTANCAACHAEDGGGTVGPNLTDSYWLHGGSLSDVFKVIKHGVPEKGMIAWEKQLKPQEIQFVASYIVSGLRGTTPANPKEPQGELWEEGAAVAAPAVGNQ
ncbi:MAG: cytochrome c class I [Cytophagaceae bacterium SCN 52-12]|nr:MAG: cytochrome c class I [Cytophagaceae bacterium SCN 52-12]